MKAKQKPAREPAAKAPDLQLPQPGIWKELRQDIASMGPAIDDLTGFYNALADLAERPFHAATLQWMVRQLGVLSERLEYDWDVIQWKAQGQDYEDFRENGVAIRRIRRADAARRAKAA